MKNKTASANIGRSGFRIPRSVQQSIPIRRIYKDGIFEVGGMYSQTWKFTDINYSVAGPEAQDEMMKAYCAMLGSLPNDAITQITLNNRCLNRQEFQRAMMMRAVGDGMDDYRGEYNRMVLEKAESGNNIVQEKYITVSLARKNIEEARTFFTRVGNDFIAGFGRLSSSVVGLDADDRLRILHDFFRMDKNAAFSLSLKQLMRRGHDFRDLICPDSMKFRAKHIEIGDGKFARVLFLKNYGSFIKDTALTALTEFPRNLMLSVDILPIPTEQAIKDVQNRILAVETDITRWQRRQNDNNNFSAQPPYDMTQMREEMTEFMTDLTMRDQRMMMGLITLVHVADSLEQLDADTDSLLSIGAGEKCEFATLGWQQEDGLNTVLPYGLHRIDTTRTLTTESVGIFLPFNTQEIRDSGGVYYGVNPISRNPIICNRKNLLNGNGFILGVSGSGKSFAAKEEIVSVALGTDDDIIVVDPEREYAPLVRALGGEIIHLSAGSQNHINAMDMARDYGDGENPMFLKSEFIMSLCEQLIGAGKLGAKGKSIIDRCMANVYRSYMMDYSGDPPTLKDLHAELLSQNEPEARDVALAIELFTSGSLNVFAHQTNVDMNRRIMLYDILDLGKQLKTVGMLVMLDAILNRVIENRRRGKRTWIYVDEIYLFFANEYSSNFLSESWKRFRKYGALATGLTQNVEDCLRSPMARTMLANSEFLLMLSQAPTDRIELANLLHISANQMTHITNVESGRGLIKVGCNLVPFNNEFPRDTALYRLMTTKPEESNGES